MKYLIAILYLIVSFTAFSQKYVDLAKFHYQSTGNNVFDSSSNETKIDELSLNITLPLKLSDKTAILTGFSIDQYTTDLTEFGDNTTISSYLLKAGVNINHNEKWNGTYLVLPKLSSDFQEKDKENFQLGAVALLKYQKNPNMRYKMGLYYNTDKFGNFFVPLFGFYYKKNKLEVDITLPSVVDVNYRIKEDLFVGLDFRAIVKSFNLTQSLQSLGQEYIEQKSNEIMGYLGYEFKNGLIVKGMVGYSVGRSYGMYEQEDKIDWGLSAFKFGDDRNQLNFDFADGLLFRAQMVYRFHIKD